MRPLFFSYKYRVRLSGLREWPVLKFAVELVRNIKYLEYGFNSEGFRKMAQSTMTVRLNETLSEFVAENVGENGTYENVSEYIRDLIRRDKMRVDQDAFERLKAELTQAYAAPDSSYTSLTAAEVIARNRK